MSNIVLIENGEAVTTSAAIAEGVGNPHKSVIQLIRQNQDDLEEFGSLAFQMRVGRSDGRGGQQAEVAILNERQATLLLTYMRNNEVVREFKKRLVREFYQLAQKAKHQDPMALLRDPAAMRELLLGYSEQVMALEQRAAEDAPKVAFHDKVAACDDFISVRDAAQVIGTGRSRLMAKLRTIGWVDKWNTPYQRTIDQGLMQSKVGQFEHPEYGLKRSITPMITGKGLVRLQRIFLEEQAA